ncbi:MAG: NAD(P)/FAD-dependent oxidoreductase [Neofamilia sp.]
MKEFNIVIIGGGAAGMMAAYAASKDNKNDVLLLEKNEKLGRKIYITGKGRCNLTNSVDISEFFDNITRNPEFLYSSLYSFDNRAVMNFFIEHGVLLKEERGMRVFPQSDKSSDIIKALSKSISKVTTILNENVVKIDKENKHFVITTDKDSYLANKVIIATGGLSYPGTGSTGDGYKFARHLGHTIVDPMPSLCPILLNDEDVTIVTGLTVKNVEISVYIDDKRIITHFGDFLFTHRGISGPLVLTISDMISGIDPNSIKLYCNFKPSIPIDELELRLLKDINSNPKREIKTLFLEYFPKSLGEYLFKKSEIKNKTKLHEIDKNLRKKILDLITNFKFEYKSVDHIRQAIVTKGGVSTKELNSKTMESKLVPNLYFCGEIIDVNALTGGFNLQIAFSTGYAAGHYAISN